jgi:hypothetical protein
MSPGGEDRFLHISSQAGHSYVGERPIGSDGLRRIGPGVDLRSLLSDIGIEESVEAIIPKR